MTPKKAWSIITMGGWVTTREGYKDACETLEALVSQPRTVVEIRRYCQERLSILRDLEKEHGGYNFQIGEYVDLLDFIDGKDDPK